MESDRPKQSDQLEPQKPRKIRDHIEHHAKLAEKFDIDKYHLLKNPKLPLDKYNTYNRIEGEIEHHVEQGKRRSDIFDSIIIQELPNYLVREYTMQREQIRKKPQDTTSRVQTEIAPNNGKKDIYLEKQVNYGDLATRSVLDEKNQIQEKFTSDRQENKHKLPDEPGKEISHKRNKIDKDDTKHKQEYLDRLIKMMNT
jgi:hypothetical protein